MTGAAATLGGVGATNSPTWAFDDATVDRTVASFDNPDYVSILINNYRWRPGLTAGDPQDDAVEERLARGPVITVPAITLDGGADGVAPATDGRAYAQKSTGRHTHRGDRGRRSQPAAGSPQAFADAVIEVGGH
jgi:hypothetical protein